MIKFSAPKSWNTRTIYNKLADEQAIYLDSKSSIILDLIKKDPYITSIEIAQQLSISRKTVSQKIKYLKEEGFIKRIGSDRKGYWEIID